MSGSFLTNAKAVTTSAQPEPVEGPARTSAVTQCWICRYNPALCGRNARKGGGPGGPAWGRRDERRLMRRSIHSLGPPDTAFHLALSAALRGEEGAPRADRLPLAFGPWTDASRKPPSPDPPTPGNVQGPVPRSRTGQIWCGGGVFCNLFGGLCLRRKFVGVRLCGLILDIA